MTTQDCAIAILCGGQSRRMGHDKGLMPFLGQPLVQRVIERVRVLSGDITLVTNQPDDYGFLGLPMLNDEQPDLGPLGGLFTAMSHCGTATLVVIACDMPFANVALLTHACAELTAHGCDAAVPVSASGPEPLHAAYRVTACLLEVRQALDQRELKTGAWLSNVRTHFIPQEEIERFDPRGLAFVNVNTPKEFAEAEMRAKSLPAA